MGLQKSQTWLREYITATTCIYSNYGVMCHMSMILGIFSRYVKITVNFVKGLVHVPTLSIFT